MQARSLPALRGAIWLVAGFALFWRNPLQIAALTVSYLLVVQIGVQLLPAIAPFLLPLALPTLTLIVANGVRLTDRRLLPSPGGLLHGVRGNGVALLRLGGLQLLGAFLLVAVSLMFDTQLRLGSMESTDDPEALAALGKLLILATPLLMAFWFAPFLVGWDNVPAAKSVFFSFVASWRNWRALTVYGLAVALVAVILPGLLIVLVAPISKAAAGGLLVAVRALMMFLLAPVLTCSIYIGYRDVFHGEQLPEISSPPAEPPARDSSDA